MPVLKLQYNSGPDFIVYLQSEKHQLHRGPAVTNRLPAEIIHFYLDLYITTVSCFPLYLVLWIVVAEAGSSRHSCIYSLAWTDNDLRKQLSVLQKHLIQAPFSSVCDSRIVIHCMMWFCRVDTVTLVRPGSRSVSFLQLCCGKSIIRSCLCMNLLRFPHFCHEATFNVGDSQSVTVVTLQNGEKLCHLEYNPTILEFSRLLVLHI